MEIISWDLNAQSDTAMLSSRCDYLFQGRLDLITLQKNEPLTSRYIGNSEYDNLLQEQMVA
jgi:hypothetical protein